MNVVWGDVVVVVVVVCCVCGFDVGYVDLFVIEEVLNIVLEWCLCDG